MVFNNYGGFYLTTKTEKEPTYNLLSYNNKNKLIRIKNQKVNNAQKNTVSQNHDAWFGLEDKNFVLFCNSTDGNILTEMEPKTNKNKLLFFSNAVYLTDKKYTLYLLPKDKILLDKYKIKNVVNYSYFFLFDFFLIPITKLVHNFFLNLEQKNGFLMALIILVLIIILINVLFIFFMEKENIKLKMYQDEKKFIENNYKGTDKQNQLNFFYKKHKIKILRIMFFPILMYISWVVLNKIIKLHFPLDKMSFLWIENIFNKDQYSLINLYGLLPFNVPKMISNFISTDILSFVFVFIYYINNQLQGEYTKGDNPMKGLLPNDGLFTFIQNVFIPLLITRDIPSCMVICIIIILTINNIIRIMIGKYFEKKYM